MLLQSCVQLFDSCNILVLATCNLQHVVCGTATRYLSFSGNCLRCPDTLCQLLHVASVCVCVCLYVPAYTTYAQRAANTFEIIKTFSTAGCKLQLQLCRSHYVPKPPSVQNMLSTFECQPTEGHDRDPREGSRQAGSRIQGLCASRNSEFCLS